MSAADLARHIAEIAERVLGEPNRKLSTRKQLRFGSHGSLCIELAGPKMGEWYDHEAGVGGGPRELLKIKGNLADADIPGWLERNLGIRQQERAGARIVKTYPYVDERGRLLFEVVRFAPKTFRQRKPDGIGGWIWSLEGVRRVPYHLDELVAAKAAANGAPWRVYVVEGERDVDRLRSSWGVLATTNPGGASAGRSKWRSEYNQHFAGADVAIIADNDDVGRVHARAVAAQLTPVASIVRIPVLGGLAEGGDISDWIDDGGSQSDLETLVETTSRYRPSEPFDDGLLVEADDDGASEPPPEFDERAPPPGAAIVDEADTSDIELWDGGDLPEEALPPREWILGNTFCRQFVSSLLGAGGVGKTALRLVQALAVATGRSLTGEHVHQRCPVLFLSFEDGVLELKRRVRAAMLHYNIGGEDIRGWFKYAAITRHKLAEINGLQKIGPGGLVQWLRATIKETGVGMVLFDPFIKTHDVDENNNSTVDQVCTLLADLTIELNISADAPHHIRKGAAEPGDADIGRGASAARDAWRLVYTATKMNKETAETCAIAENERHRFFRVDSAKVNIAPPLTDAVWFELVNVPIGNATPQYPNGDQVQTVRRWYPSSFWQGLDITVLNKILDNIDAGPYDGGRYSPAPNAKERAAWPVILKFYPDLSEKQAKSMIATWIKNGVLEKRMHEDPNDRHEHASLFVGKRPGDSFDI